MSPRESYLQTLKLLRKQRHQLVEEIDELDNVITGLERLAKREASPGPEDSSHDELPDHPMVGPYADMELIPAVEHYLREYGMPQTSQEIADALVARGFRTRSKDFRNTVQALLKRANDAGGRSLRRIGKSTWTVDDSTAGGVS